MNNSLPNNVKYQSYNVQQRTILNTAYRRALKRMMRSYYKVTEKVVLQEALPKIQSFIYKHKYKHILNNNKKSRLVSKLYRYLRQYT